MKKFKLLLILTLAAVMVLGMFPVAAGAADQPPSIDLRGNVSTVVENDTHTELHNITLDCGTGGDVQFSTTAQTIASLTVTGSVNSTASATLSAVEAAVEEIKLNGDAALKAAGTLHAKTIAIYGEDPSDPQPTVEIGTLVVDGAVTLAFDTFSGTADIDKIVVMPGGTLTIEEAAGTANDLANVTITTLDVRGTLADSTTSGTLDLPTALESEITPSSADCDKTPGAPNYKDIAVEMTLRNSDLLTGITGMEENTDYTINSSTVTLKKEALANLGTGSQTVTFNFSSGTADLALNVTQSPTYGLTYDANGGLGTVPTDTNQYVSGAKAMVAGPGGLSKPSFTFAGWNTAADGNGTPYVQGGELPFVDAPITLFAQWTLVTHSVLLPTGTGYTAAPVSGYGTPVADGADYQFTVTVQDDYYLKGVNTNGTPLTASKGVYTISNIKADQTVDVQVGKIGFTTEPGGPVKKGSDAHFVIAGGNDKDVTAVRIGGLAYTLDGKGTNTVNIKTSGGTDVGKIIDGSIDLTLFSSYLDTLQGGSYKLGVDFAGQTVETLFTLARDADPEPVPTLFTVKASAGDHGKIDPSGDVQVKAGASQTFTFTPDKGYAVSKVLVDGKEVKFADNKYTLGDVQATHTIRVEFKVATAGGVKTGDETVIWPYILLVIAAAGAVVGVLLYRRRARMR